MINVKLSIFLFVSIALISSCRGGIDIPTEFPTPPPLPSATPLAKIALKPDLELEQKIKQIAVEAKGKVGVAAVVLETGESASLNADQHFPMQSVYKLPISIAVMEKVRLGELELDEKIGVTKDDMVREGQHSPLRDKNPTGGEFTIRELIRLAIVESDGTASDVLMRVAGGASEIQYFLTQIGINDMKVVNTEKELGANWQTQYDNWATPTDAVELLRWMQITYENANKTKDEGKSENIVQELTYKNFIRWCLSGSSPGANRLKSTLPSGTDVAHKTGTSGTQNGITAATNDIGVVTLPDGKHIAIAVFVSDSPADEKTREAVIAKIAKACWDKWTMK